MFKRNYSFFGHCLTVCCLVVAWCFKSSIFNQPKWRHKLPLGGYGPLCPPWRRHWLDPFILFLIFKFKFIDCEKTEFKFIDFEKSKFKFIDFEKSKFKFKFIDFEKSKFKFIDFEKVESKFINNSWTDSNSKFKFNATLLRAIAFPKVVKEFFESKRLFFEKVYENRIKRL